MALTIDDLKPQDTTVTIKGVSMRCKPLRLSHALILTQVGEIFQNAKDASIDDIKKAEKNMDDIVAELIPELAGVSLDIGSMIEIITQMVSQMEPSDNAELRNKGVTFASDPKAETIG
jgi:hypothetical protein